VCVCACSVCVCVCLYLSLFAVYLYVVTDKRLETALRAVIYAWTYIDRRMDLLKEDA